MKESFLLKHLKRNALHYLHLVPILTLYLATISSINNTSIFLYTLLTCTFLVSTFITLDNLLKNHTSIFYYLLNILFTLGFLFKFSVQKILKNEYREPIGLYNLTNGNEVNVLTVIILGILGFLISSIVMNKYLIKPIAQEQEQKKSKPPIFAVGILMLTIILSLINFKYNILLFALKPSLTLPFKGNVIFFLILTRGLIFLFFYYCLTNHKDKKIAIIGGILALISSIGVLSRMGTVLFFLVIFLSILTEAKNLKPTNILKNFFFYLFSLFIISYLGVFISTSLRETIFKSTSLTNEVKIDLRAITHSESFNQKSRFKNFLELAAGRWVGIEGVLAIEAYPKKSFNLLLDALNEKSYNGDSFYSHILNPELKRNAESKVISTSVTGPLAFFYYSGSKFFVFGAMFTSCFIFGLLEKYYFQWLRNHQMAAIYTSVFITFDFYQFGISPIAFLKYLSFSLFSIYATVQFNNLIHKKN